MEISEGSKQHQCLRFGILLVSILPTSVTDHGSILAYFISPFLGVIEILIIKDNIDAKVLSNKHINRMKRSRMLTSLNSANGSVLFCCSRC